MPGGPSKDNIEPKEIAGSFGHLPDLPPPKLHHSAAQRILGWDMDQRLGGGDMDRRAAAVHPTGDRRGNIRHLNMCHESYKSSQNLN